MIRIVLTAATCITLAQAVLADGVGRPTGQGLTAQIDSFHGASGTGKTVTAGPLR
ncbi:hypothetical protein [Pseudoponticoccus marisrubri]|uniref:hypothetical protein n=1 Tax=Pseudoponticoccus marisrubri TaxID=1685382 RepID=UPI0012FD37B5|nr:hypothetical protein [Pseudoponticoccus marisrubri]